MGVCSAYICVLVGEKGQGTLYYCSVCVHAYLVCIYVWCVCVCVCACVCVCCECVCVNVYV